MGKVKDLFDVQHMHITELKKGLNFASHRHDTSQLYAVLEGKVAYSCDGKNFLLHDAEGLVISPGKPRSLEVLSDCGRALVVNFNADIPITSAMKLITFNGYQIETARKLADAISAKTEPPSITYMRFNYLATEIFDIDFSNFSRQEDYSFKVCSAAEQLMEANLEKLIKLDDIAKLVGISRAGLERAFRKHYRVSVMRRYRMIRIAAARKMLEKGVSISEAAYLTGFSSPQHFATVFKTETEMVPSSI